MTTDTVQPGTRVRVYRNLHTGNFSVQCCKTGLVIARVASIELSNVRFIVRQAGRLKVLAEKRKNVHAFVVGTVTRNATAASRQVSYNPYKMDSFCLVENAQPVITADFVRLANNKIFV